VFDFVVTKLQFFIRNVFQDFATGIEIINRSEKPGVLRGLSTLKDRPLPDLALLRSVFMRHKIAPFLPNGGLSLLLSCESSRNRFAASCFDHLEGPNRSPNFVTFHLFERAKTIDGPTHALMKFHHLLFSFACFANFSTNWPYKT
jgi:hypothetical protein